VASRGADRLHLRNHRKTEGLCLAAPLDLLQLHGRQRTDAEQRRRRPHLASALSRGGVYADVVAALVSGSAISLWDRFSPNEFWDRIEAYGATKTILLSVIIPWLLQQPESPDDDENPLKMVHMQPLPDNYDELAERFGFDIVTAGFGQTESGNPLAGFIRTDPGDGDDSEGMAPSDIVARAEDLRVPVVDEVPEDRYMGKPAFFMDAAILDENYEELPTGETGELAFRPHRSEILMKEYYGKPERNLDAFRNLWFHTGDVAYRDEEGNFCFVDRMGDVIRRRGENISSMQVQDAINAHEAVGQAAVFPIPDEEGGEDEIGTAIGPADDSFDDSELYEFLDERLPGFMHPDELLVVDELPTTETNKIEKYKLRDRLADR
jgi:crotonobetaine/carnitine-CoA ligase